MHKIVFVHPKDTPHEIFPLQEIDNESWNLEHSVENFFIRNLTDTSIFMIADEDKNLSIKTILNN